MSLIEIGLERALYWPAWKIHHCARYQSLLSRELGVEALNSSWGILTEEVVMHDEGAWVRRREELIEGRGKV